MSFVIRHVCQKSSYSCLPSYSVRNIWNALTSTCVVVTWGEFQRSRWSVDDIVFPSFDESQFLLYWLPKFVVKLHGTEPSLSHQHMNGHVSFQDSNLEEGKMLREKNNFKKKKKKHKKLKIWSSGRSVLC